MKHLSLQFIRFLVVGGVCLVLNLSLLYVLTDKLGLHYLLSCCIVVLLVNYVGFQLNKLFTFTRQSPYIKGETIMQFIKYNAVSVVSFVLAVGQMYVLVDFFGMWYIYASAVSSVVMAFINFGMHKYFTYKEHVLT